MPNNLAFSGCISSSEAYVPSSPLASILIAPSELRKMHYEKSSWDPVVSVLTPVGPISRVVPVRRKHVVKHDRMGDENMQSGEALGAPFEGHTNRLTSVAFSPDGKHIVSGSDDRTVCVWDAESREALGAPFKGHTAWVTSVAFSPDGKCIVSMCKCFHIA
ncbi:WD40-repeat-containing domain protein [Mycena sp. CBHHK59/15]|nr:WD40-repeat-containing domain protein [Mycena sp. CBHHK59/15]